VRQNTSTITTCFWVRFALGPHVLRIRNSGLVGVPRRPQPGTFLVLEEGLGQGINQVWQSFLLPTMTSLRTSRWYPSQMGSTIEAPMQPQLDKTTEEILSIVVRLQLCYGRLSGCHLVWLRADCPFGKFTLPRPLDGRKKEMPNPFKTFCCWRLKYHIQCLEFYGKRMGQPYCGLTV